MLHVAKRLRVPTVWRGAPRPGRGGGMAGSTIPSSASTPTPAWSGVYGVPTLRDPASFAALAACAHAAAEQLVGAVTAQPSPTWTPDTILPCLQAVDGVSNILCQVLDAAEATRHVHAEASWRQAADDLYMSFVPYLHHLNTHRPLYDVLSSVAASAAFPTLHPEHQRLVISLVRELEREGIHLPSEHKTALMRLRGAEAHAVAALQAVPPSTLAEDAPAGLTVTTQMPVERWAAWMSQASETGVPQSVTGGDSGGGGHVSVAITTEFQATGVLQSCPHEPTRKAAWMGLYGTSSAVSRARTDAAVALRDRRHELAAFIGFPSYADMALSDRMVTDPLVALSFLADAAHVALPRAVVECAALTGWSPSQPMPSPMLQGGGGGVSAQHGVDGRGATTPITVDMAMSAWAWCRKHRVRAWDVQARHGVLAGQAPPHPPHNAGPPTPSVWRNVDGSTHIPWFTLGRVLQGLATIVQWVYGIGMRPLTVDDLPAKWRHAHGVNAYELVDQASGDSMGLVHIDVGSRSGKAPGAAHYTIQCGKQGGRYDTVLHRMMRDGAVHASLGDVAALMPLAGRVVDAATVLSPATDADTTGWPPQLPVVVLSASLVPTLSNLGDMMAHALTYRQVVTLFHEFGHALHSLLSRTRYQHTAGTRTTMDFVEVPSHLMQTFLRDYRVTAMWARDDAGEPIPEPVFRRVVRQHESTCGMGLQETVSYALFDLALHGAGKHVDALQRRSMHLKRALDDTEGSQDGYVSQLMAEALNKAPPITLPPSTLHPASQPMRVGASGASSRGMTTAERMAWHRDPHALYSAITDGYTLVPSVSGSAAWHVASRHLTTYGAGYYSYIYAEALAEQVWHSVFAADPWSRSAGARWRDAVLSKGGSEEPMTMINDVLQGAPPSLQPLASHLHQWYLD